MKIQKENASKKELITHSNIILFAYKRERRTTATTYNKRLVQKLK